MARLLVRWAEFRNPGESWRVAAKQIRYVVRVSANEIVLDPGQTQLSR
jgi:hypothetical protein